MIPTLTPPSTPPMRAPDHAQPGEVDRRRQVEFEHAMRQRADNGAQEQARQLSRYTVLVDHQQRSAQSRRTASVPGRAVKPERPVNERCDASQDDDSSNNPANTGPEQANTSQQPTDNKPRNKVQLSKDTPDKATTTPDAPGISERKLLLGKPTSKALEALLGQTQPTEHKAQGAIEPLAVALYLPGQTPGDRLLAQLLADPQMSALKQDLEHLLTAMQARIQHPANTSASNSTLLQISLQHLGAVEIQLVHGRGKLHIEVQASSGTLLHLQQARGELLERLHKLNPGQGIQLAFADSGDADQRSRQRRHLEDEWEPEL